MRGVCSAVSLWLERLPVAEDAQPLVLAMPVLCEVPITICLFYSSLDLSTSVVRGNFEFLFQNKTLKVSKFFRIF